jgi:isoleucyl-tRNA synthetase
MTSTPQTASTSQPGLSHSGQPYPTVESSPSFPRIEEGVLDRWEKQGAFPASVGARPAGEKGSNEYVFYDGPPFANGLPHYGHLLTGYVKDAIPRYQTMRGRRVERRFGWDCHGLPAEVEAEKQLGISGKPEIEKMGVARFNAACQESVLRYTRDWERYVTRQARWVDFENDYKTLDLPYMESVMWAFKTLFDKGLIYEGYRVLPYCWRCETPLSNTETRMDDVYKQRQDPAVTVMFRLLDETGAPSKTSILAWTTTPWTLPSNLALAVNADVEYAVMEEPSGEQYIVASPRVGAYSKELAEATQVATVIGRELVGRRYLPLFDFFADTQNAFQVLAAEYVTTEDGTGIVHLAPAFGEEDKAATDSVGIPVRNPIDAHGCFTSEVPPYQGMQVFDANNEIIKDLRAQTKLVRRDSYDHSYPHCWRCDSPLIYRAVSSWFVEVTKIRDRMVELNQEITWVPAHIQEGSFGKWIGNARDWSISRNRFWGSPIPVWKSDDPTYPRIDVYGSLEELHRDFGVEVTDLHRPFVDDLVRPNPDDPTGKSMMRRVPEVLDCWFESGSMPFAQVHYPFENKDWLENHYPADFIVEYIGQTRGWFYTLHVLATALFDRPSFSTCLAHGILLGSDGEKMSKSKKNYPDVYEAFDSYGSDAVRWSLLSSTVLRGGDAVVKDESFRDAVRQAILPMWNTWYFFSLYANTSKYQARFRTDSTAELDQYLMAKVRVLVADVTEYMDQYDLFNASAAVRSFLDTLTNWYIRRSRDRFWDGESDDAHAAFDTLYTALHTLCRVAAPLLPMVCEEIYTGLDPAAGSVHLADWPVAQDYPADPSLVSGMDLVRDLCSSALSVRKARGLRVRLPLASVTVAHPDAPSLQRFAPVIAEELNVKDVRLTADVGSAGSFVLQVVPGVLGPRIGKQVQAVIAAVKKGEWTTDAATGRPAAAGVVLEEGEYSMRLQAADAEASSALPGNSGVVSLDLDVTSELHAEGLARDVIRAVQQARRDAGLEVSDRIALVVSGPDVALDALRTHRNFVAGEVLATAVELLPTDAAPAGATPAEVGDGVAITISVTKA